MGNEERGDGADTEHLSDSGLQVREISPVAELRVSFPSNLSVELGLDLCLHLEEFHIITKISFLLIWSCLQGQLWSRAATINKLELKIFW